MTGQISCILDRFAAPRMEAVEPPIYRRCCRRARRRWTNGVLVVRVVGGWSRNSATACTRYSVAFEIGRVRFGIKAEVSSHCTTSECGLMARASQRIVEMLPHMLIQGSLVRESGYLAARVQANPFRRRRMMSNGSDGAAGMAAGMMSIGSDRN